jgi:predicted alpha/beta hydrolase
VPFRLPHARLELQWKPDDVYRVTTADGATIALGRYNPRGPRRFAEGVVLAHGVAANRFDLDFDARYSLAQLLARRGFETWVLELRGRGVAGKPIDANFDEEAEHDVGAALKTVLSTGSPQVLWVGHSKGGLLAYAHLAKNPQAPIKAIAALGTPATFPEHKMVNAFLEYVQPFLSLTSIPLRLPAMAGAPIGLPPGPIAGYLANADNMDPLVVRQAIYNVTANIPGGVARQFARWVRHNRFDSEDGFDYRKGMKAIRAPMLLVAGEKDLLAPVSSVRAAIDFTGGPTEFLRLNKQNGFSADYGHGDLMLGRNAPDEVFPRVAEFLEKHASPSTGSG